MSDLTPGSAALGYTPRAPRGITHSFPVFSECFDQDGHAHGLVLYHVDESTYLDRLGPLPPKGAVTVPALGVVRPSANEDSYVFFPYAMCTNAHPLINSVLAYGPKIEQDLQWQNHELRKKEVAGGELVRPLDFGGYFPKGIEIPHWMATEVSLVDVEQWTVIIHNLRNYSDEYLGHTDLAETVHDMVVNRPGRYCAPVTESDESQPYYEAEELIEEEAILVLNQLSNALGRQSTWAWPLALQQVWITGNEQFRQGVAHMGREEEDAKAERAPLPVEDWEEVPTVDEFQNFIDRDSHIHYANAGNNCEKCQLLWIKMRTSFEWEPGELAAAMSPPEEVRKAAVTPEASPREDLIFS